MSLPDETIEELKKAGYEFIDSKGFYESYSEEAYLIFRKNRVKMIGRFVYCSCYGLYSETKSSVITALKTMTHGRLDMMIESAYLDKEAQIKWLEELK